MDEADLQTENHLRHLRDLQMELDRALALSDAELTRISNWRAEETERVEKQMDFHRNSCEIFMRSTNAKTLRFPSGKLVMRKQPKKVVIDDEEAFTRWAATNAEDLVRVKFQADKKAIAGLREKDDCVVTDEGEVLPHVVITRAEDKFSIELNDTGKVVDGDD